MWRLRMAGYRMRYGGSWWWMGRRPFVFGKNETELFFLLLVLLVARGCLRLDVCEVAQLCCRPCRMNKKGKIIGRLLSLLMGDARPRVRSWRHYLELAGSVALVVATLSSVLLEKNYLTKNLIRMWALGFAFSRKYSWFSCPQHYCHKGMWLGFREFSVSTVTWLIFSFVCGVGVHRTTQCYRSLNRLEKKYKEGRRANFWDELDWHYGRRGVFVARNSLRTIWNRLWWYGCLVPLRGADSSASVPSERGVYQEWRWTKGQRKYPSSSSNQVLSYACWRVELELYLDVSQAVVIVLNWSNYFARVRREAWIKFTELSV